MKVDSKHLTVFPHARYVVTPTGVQMIVKTPNELHVLNISRQYRQYCLMNIIMKHGLGKQYV